MARGDGRWNGALNVFEAVGYTLKSVVDLLPWDWVDRFAMLKYNIPDIRLLYEK